MESTLSINKLWQFISSLSYDNKKFLADHLIENLHKEDEDTISKEEILAGIDAGLKDLKAGRMQNAWDVLKELKDEGYC